MLLFVLVLVIDAIKMPVVYIVVEWKVLCNYMLKALLEFLSFNVSF